MKYTFAYGAAAGIAMGIIDGVIYNYLYDTKIAAYGILINLIVMVAIMLLAIKHISKAKHDSQINYFQATLAGIMVATHAGVFLGLFTYIYFSFGNQEFIQHTLEMGAEVLAEQDLTEEEAEEKLSELKRSFTPLRQALSSFQGTFIIGTFLALIIGFFTKKKNAASST
ncbi:DUF4199 domain-containing protein [Cytophagaceae bacterium ABcell3]|nr:DUF4199 domain-containing protein [Cytophagaceae bacterium ABcell3]